MSGKTQWAAALAAAWFMNCATSATAGPIAVFTEIMHVGTADDNNSEVHVSGLGSWATLTWMGDTKNLITVSADQTSGRQEVAGFGPVIGFRDPAQYEAQRGTVVTVPPTPVSILAEVWNGEYGLTRDVRDVYFNAIVSGQVSATPGRNVVDWQFVDLSKQVRFGDAVVTISYSSVRVPDGTPQIQFQDGSPAIGFPGPFYYPSLLEATVEVARPTIDPPGGSGSGGAATTPEPASAVLFAGFMLGGLAARRARRAAR